MQFILTVLYHLSWIRALCIMYISLLLSTIDQLGFYSTLSVACHIQTLKFISSTTWDVIPYISSSASLHSTDTFFKKSFALLSFVFTFVLRQYASTYSRLSWGLNKPLWLCSPCIGTENNHFCHLILAKYNTYHIHSFLWFYLFL